MKKGMVVLSLYDGISCGMIALERAGIKVDKYYASEIDKYAEKVSEKNYPEIIRLGDVLDHKKWRLPKIDLLIGGSPRQSFSFAGKQLSFEDPRSKLFFEFVRLLKKYKPKYFLLENVKMKKDFQDIISKHLKEDPILINSSLVSAQNRERLYWTNINIKKQPKDRCIFLKDITIDGSLKVGRMVGRRINKKTGKREDYNKKIKPVQRIEPRLDSKSGTITTVQKDNLVLTEKAIEYMNRKVKGGRIHWGFSRHSDVKKEKSSAVVANFFKGVPYNVLIDYDCIRHFHPIECERLQTIDDNYTEGISKTQRLKALGNAWTVDVIVHIFKSLKRM